MTKKEAKLAELSGTKVNDLLATQRSAMESPLSQSGGWSATSNRLPPAGWAWFTGAGFNDQFDREKLERRKAAKAGRYYEEENPQASASGRGLQSFKRKLSSKKESTVEEVEVVKGTAMTGLSLDQGMSALRRNCSTLDMDPLASTLTDTRIFQWR